MKSILSIAIILSFVSCASFQNPRGIKESKLDGLKAESLKRYDALRLDSNLKLKSELESISLTRPYDDKNHEA